MPLFVLLTLDDSWRPPNRWRLPHGLRLFRRLGLLHRLGHLHGFRLPKQFSPALRSSTLRMLDHAFEDVA